MWAIGLAAAASRTTNPILLGLILAVTGLVVAARRGDAPWARAFPYYLALAGIVIAIRIGFRVVFGGGAGSGEHVLFTLPHLPLPSWLSGVRVGGAVTAEATASAAVDGLRLACLLCCVGAANALTDPRRALRLLPGALYEIGVAVVVALSTAPQLIESVQRVRRARRLRGGGSTGWRAVRAVAVPVLEDALDRSLRLAAAMDARGYGRGPGDVTTCTPAADPTATRPDVVARGRRLTATLLLAGLAGLCVGTYGLLAAGTTAGVAVGGLLGGGALCVGGLGLGQRRLTRTRYRPDRWLGAEWAVVGAGLVPAVVLVAGVATSAAELSPSVVPLTWPPLPLVAAAAVLVAALPAVVAPPPPAAGGPPPSAAPAPTVAAAASRTPPRHGATATAAGVTANPEGAAV